MRQRPVWAVVPVKPFALAKQRMAGLLDASDRSRLARVMLDDVLSTLRTLDHLLAGTIVVTADPDAARLAAWHGARVLREAEPMGLNAAVRCAVAALRCEPEAGMLVVPTDLPHLPVATLTRVVHLLRNSAHVVVVPATSDAGTNLLGCSPASVIAPRFGPLSFSLHCASARRAGVAVTVVRDDHAGHDLDRPADVAQFLSFGNDSATQALLARLTAGSRHG